MESIGRYQVVRELGRGAMGVVYLATDPAIGRPVAIKTIRLGDVDNPQERERLRERLLREARSAGALSHPGIVTIYDVQEAGDSAYIAMEYVNGPTLDRLLSEPAPLAPERMFGILGQTALALDYAHQKGVVHRDIKPANIMIDEQGTAKITDFGIAKFTASEQFTLTGAILGTPHYMSPEQVQGHTVDGRSDQFSLSVIAYEMLTGEKPFNGEQLSTVVYRIVAEEPPAPRRLNATIGPQIETVLQRGLAKKPDERFATCQQFVEALEHACRATKGWRALPRGASLSQPTVGVLPPGPMQRRAAAAALDTTSIRERRRIGVLPFLMAILVAAGLVGLIAWQAAPWLAESPGGLPPAAKEDSAAAPPAPDKKPSPMRGSAAAETPPPSAASQQPQNESGAAQTPTTRPAQVPASESTQAAAQTPAPEPVKPAPAQSTPVAEQPKPPQEQPKPALRRVEAQEAEHQPAPRRPATAARQAGLQITTSPAGATAKLDYREDTACITPCVLEASPGRHTVVVTKPGHQSETREVEAGHEAQELPIIFLRSTGGTLMLTSSPPGAKIYVNGRQWQGTTPAQINLSPGSYVISVEKDGNRVSQPVTIKNGATQILRIPIG